jgi:CheY-like chemotaxis protein
MFYGACQTCQNKAKTCQNMLKFGKRQNLRRLALFVLSVRLCQSRKKSEPVIRFELMTNGLQNRCSTTELNRRRRATFLLQYSQKATSSAGRQRRLQQVLSLERGSLIIFWQGIEKRFSGCSQLRLFLRVGRPVVLQYHYIQVLRGMHANAGISGVMKDSLRVLHAEDSDDCAVLVRRAMRLAGFGRPPLRFSDGVAAIDHLAKAPANERPHVILLDVNMPLKNGFDVLGWLREHPEYSATPVVMLTSSQEAEDIRRAESLGATKFLQKEGTYRAVVETLEALLEKSG